MLYIPENEDPPSLRFGLNGSGKDKTRRFVRHVSGGTGSCYGSLCLQPFHYFKTVVIACVLMGLVLIYRQQSVLNVVSTAKDAATGEDRDVPTMDGDPNEQALFFRGREIERQANDNNANQGDGSYPSFQRVIEESKASRLERQVKALEKKNRQLINEQRQSKKGSSSGDSAGTSKDQFNLWPLGLQAPAAWRKIRIYCMVPTLYEAHRMEKLIAVARSWGQRCDVIKFFIDIAPENVTHPTHFDAGLGVPKIELVQIPIMRENDEMVKDKFYTNKSCSIHSKQIPCRHIWEKVWRSWVYIAEHDLDKADYFFKIDDDSFVFIEFLKWHIWRSGWDSEDDHYFGHVSYQGPKPFVNGAIVGLSRSTVRKVAEKYKVMPNEYGPRDQFKHHRCVDRDGASQEITEAICLFELGIDAEPLLDQNGIHTIALFRISNSLFFRRRVDTKSWYWYKKPRSQICCSEFPVGFHWYKRPADILRLERLFDPQDHFLDDQNFDRPLMDKFMKNPGQMVDAVVSNTSTIPLYAYMREIEYLWKVRSNLKALLPDRYLEESNKQA